MDHQDYIGLCRSTVIYAQAYDVMRCAAQNTLDTRRTGANETMLGAAQEADLAQDTNAASSPGPNQTVWQQYLGGLVMLVCLVSSTLSLDAYQLALEPMHVGMLVDLEAFSS